MENEERIIFKHEDLDIGKKVLCTCFPKARHNLRISSWENHIFTVVSYQDNYGGFDSLLYTLHCRELGQTIKWSLGCFNGDHHGVNDIIFVPFDRYSEEDKFHIIMTGRIP